ncbi:MAG: acyl-CoA synthetase, partial [Candidatus Caldarchaeum sp.]
YQTQSRLTCLTLSDDGSELPPHNRGTKTDCQLARRHNRYPNSFSSLVWGKQCHQNIFKQAHNTIKPMQAVIPETLNMAWDVCDKWVDKGRGGDPAIYIDHRRVTYSELKDLSDRFAYGLASLGIKRGDRILFRLRNCLEYTVACLGAWKKGAVPSFTNTLFRTYELQHILANSEAIAVITSKDLLPPIEEAKSPYLKHTIIVDEPEGDQISFKELMSGPRISEIATTSKDERAFIFYTSGTTGFPKGVAHAHRWIVATGEPISKIMMDLHHDDKVLHPQEYSFIYPFGCGFVYSLHAGASIIIFSGRPTPEKFFEYIEKYRPTVICTVPTMYRMMLAVKDAEKLYDLSSVRHGISAGETLPSSTFEEWKRRFGITIYDGLGQTEIHIFVAETPRMKVKPGSCGKPFPGFVVKILDDDGKELKPGEVGHIAIKDDNPGLFIEYIKNSEKWEQTHKYGYYFTGDLGYYDEDGYFWYVSRADDIIKSRGYLISPMEVERVILEVPGVLEAAVVGAPDEIMGSKVKAFVTLRPGYEPSEEMMQKIVDHVKQRIAPYKAPKEIEFVNELPKTPTGKILRRMLRQAEAEKYAKQQR